MDAFFAPAKLNLFLHVTGRRADGYHLLETVFQLIDFGDTVRLAVRADGRIRRVNLLAGIPEADDLAVRAAQVLKAETGCALGVDIEIEKCIPAGGGLGGGSSDAATVLLALNRLWNLGLTRAHLMQLGLKLGADVPFFIFGRNAFATGVGEELQGVELPSHSFVVIKPQVEVPTAAIFGSPELTRNAKSVKLADFSAGVLTGRLAGGQNRSQTGVSAGDSAFAAPAFRNDLEAVAKAQFPAVEVALEWLRRHDAGAVIQARMTGSGACVFAGFREHHDAKAVLMQRPAFLSGFVARGLSGHPLADFA